MFEYSKNNPVNMSDPSGFMPIFDIGDDYNFTPRFIKKYSNEILDSVEVGAIKGFKEAVSGTFGSGGIIGAFIGSGAASYHAGKTKQIEMNKILEHKIESGLYSKERLRSYVLKDIPGDVNFERTKGGAKGGLEGLAATFIGCFIAGFYNGCKETLRTDMKVRREIEYQDIWDRG